MRCRNVNRAVQVLLWTVSLACAGAEAGPEHGPHGPNGLEGSTTGLRHQTNVFVSGCQASIRRYSWPGDNDKSVILFSNPASTHRERLTLRASVDEGRT